LFTAPKQQLLCVGPLKGEQSRWIGEGWQRYAKRLAPYCPLEVIEVAAGHSNRNATAEQVKAEEEKRIKPYWEKAGLRMVLSEHGKTYTSPAFAETFCNMCLTGNPINGGLGNRPGGVMLWVVGGAYGVAPGLVQQANWVVSLSPLTFPHQWVRLLWVEQLYRAFTLLNNTPYHK
jgi:23S rRNA (pseudouridine1915-N3)-methyltransferase